MTRRDANGKDLWKETDPKTRRRVALAMKRGQRPGDRREARLAMYMAEREKRQLRIVWFYILLSAVAGFALAVHAGNSFTMSLGYGAIFGGSCAAVTVPIVHREKRRLERALAINRASSDEPDVH